MAFINIKNVLRNLKENMNIMESNGRFFWKVKEFVDVKIYYLKWKNTLEGITLVADYTVQRKIS